MHRVTCPATVARGDTRIITHTTENSSRVEIGDRVYINVKDRVKPAAVTQSPLAQRNTDSMKFAWDPIQVVNLSRQQKAVCTRELTRLSHLQRHFTRQSQLEKYKQTTQIDKYRRRLVRLHSLRASESDVNNPVSFRTTNNTNAAKIGVVDSDVKSPRSLQPLNRNTTNIVGSQEHNLERNSRRYRSVEKSDPNIILQKPVFDTHGIRTDNSNYKSTIKYMNKGDYFTPSIEANVPRMYFIKTIDSADQQFTKAQLASIQRAADCVLNPCWQSFDKQYRADDGSESVTDRSQYDYNKVELINVPERKLKLKSFINTSGDQLSEQLPKLVGGEKKKSVKFSDNLDTVFHLNDTCSTTPVANKRKRPGIKAFVRMASMAKQFEKL